ncbi:MAG: hypothetical protein ABL929_06825 [Ferruginibacter sp.]|nr:hypothetical protein [Ferruginibacter sp.]
MDIYYKKWLQISFLNLFIVAVLGFLLRYKIAFYLPFIDQKNVLHSHSHFAFAGWITQTFMVLLINNLTTSEVNNVSKRYNWLLYANCITAFGMLITFFANGYNLFSNIFSALSIFVSFYFALLYWKDLNTEPQKKVSHLWIKASLVFSVISSIGVFGLVYMMVNKVMIQNWQLASVYFYLHFQYNGWFLFAGLGLLVAKLEMEKNNIINLKRTYYLFVAACVPAYLLSVLWVKLPIFIHLIVVIAVIAQLIGWAILIKVIKQNIAFVQHHFTKFGSNLLLLSAIAFTIKLVLQFGSVHPALSQLSYGFRPIIIGYLHLVLLAITSIFLIGYIVSFNLIRVTKYLKIGIVIFVVGVIANEILLMVQGVAALSYHVVPHIDILLLGAAFMLFVGIFVIFLNTIFNTVK